MGTPLSTPTSIGTSIVRNKNPRYSTLKRRNGKGVAQSHSEKADEFNDQFTDVFNLMFSFPLITIILHYFWTTPL